MIAREREARGGGVTPQPESTGEPDVSRSLRTGTRLAEDGARLLVSGSDESQKGLHGNRHGRLSQMSTGHDHVMQYAMLHRVGVGVDAEPADAEDLVHA